MEQRDYLMIQVKQLALVLKKLLSTLLPGKNIGTETGASFDRELSESLGYDIGELCAIEDEHWIEALLNIPSLTPSNLEKLADLLFVLAEATPELYPKCLLIYRYLETSEKTYSLERNAKIDIIESLKKNR